MILEKFIRLRWPLSVDSPCSRRFNGHCKGAAMAILFQLAKKGRVHTNGLLLNACLEHDQVALLVGHSV